MKLELDTYKPRSTHSKQVYLYLATFVNIESSKNRTKNALKLRNTTSILFIQNQLTKNRTCILKEPEHSEEDRMQITD